MINILFLGDIVGRPGRQIVAAELPKLREELAPSLVIANAENAAGGLGVDKKCVQELLKAGVELLTLGNHTWKKKEISQILIDEKQRIIRPENYPPGAPGSGQLLWRSPQGWTLSLINIMGRVFIPEILDCPFQAVDRLLASDTHKADVCFVDFHGEATSEKVAMGYHLDGRVQVVVGTHTHVQTADERVLPNGTAYITDVGMCGPLNGVIGVDAKLIVQRFIDGLPSKFELAKGPTMINAVVVSLDETTFEVKGIQRIQKVSS